MGSITAPIYHNDPNAEITQQVGQAIAKYGLFGFLDSSRSTGPMLPSVRQNLPDILRSSLDQAIANRTQSTRRKRGIKRFLTNVLSNSGTMFSPAPNTYLGTASNLASPPNPSFTLSPLSPPNAAALTNSMINSGSLVSSQTADMTPPLGPSPQPFGQVTTKDLMAPIAPTIENAVSFASNMADMFHPGSGAELQSAADHARDRFFSAGDDFLDGLRRGSYAGKSWILTDSSWGTTTVQTRSLMGDQAWSTTLAFGSAGQPLNINIDSGSSDLILYDPSCQTCSLSNHTAFDHNRSSSFARYSNTFGSTYADQSTMGGYLAKDIISIGNRLRINKQVFGMATSVSAGWAALGYDGLMGIGPDTLSFFPTAKPQGVFSRLIAEKALASPQLGIALVKKEASNGGTRLGEFSFGSINKKWIRGSIAWRPVTSKNFWGLTMSGIYVNGVNTMTSNDPPRAIIDTGTSLTIVTEAVSDAIHQSIQGAVKDNTNGIWRIPCPKKGPASSAVQKSSTFATSAAQGFGLSSLMRRTFSKSMGSAPTPNVFFEFGTGTERFGIPGSDLAYQTLPRYDLLAGQMCYSGIQSGATTFFVLGDTFIKNHYIVFKDDPSGKKIGLANRTDVPILY